jgi:adenylate cyclase
MEIEPLPRKLAVIMHADIAGYTLLFERDEDSAHRLVTESFDVLADTVERYGGTVLEKRGDALLAEFGPPSDAISCALMFQQAVSRRFESVSEHLRPWMRIGINLGEVIIDRGTVWGPGVNLAQRVEQLAEPGGVCASRAVYDAVSKSLRVEYEDLGEILIKNVLVRACRVRLPEGVELAPTRVDTSAPVPGFGGRAAVAVLPFVNRSPGDDMDYLAEGIAEDVITRLQRFRTVPVISRSASFVYQGDQQDLRRVTRELGVGYAVTGRLRRAGERIRLAVDLVDTTSSTSIWAMTYDRTMADLFDLQDEISLSVASMLEPELERAEISKPASRDRDQNQAWHLVRRGVWHQYRLTRDDAREALRFFESALDRDPTSGEAMIQLAWWHWWATTQSRNREHGAWNAMEGYVRQARAVDPQDSRISMLAGIAEMMKGNLMESRRLFQTSLDLNPSFAQAHCYLGSTHTLMGEPDKAITPIETSLRLSPFGFTVFHTFGELANAHYMLGNWDEAVSNADTSLRLRPGYWLANIIKVGALARAGNMAGAHHALTDLVTMRADELHADINWIMYSDSQWNRYLTDGLVMAGWNAPEGAYR